MVNLWSVLAQTLALSVAAAVLLAAKRLFLDKLSPRWQYGVWAILALRALLPAGLLGRTLVPGGRVVLEAARLQVELPLSSALTDPYGVTEVLAPVPLFPRPARAGEHHRRALLPLRRRGAPAEPCGFSCPTRACALPSGGASPPPRRCWPRWRA